MKTLGIVLTIVMVLLLILDFANGITGSYQYEKQINSYWELADKASSITKKAENIDLFVAVLEKSNLQGQHNALILTTPNNGFDMNFEALKTLQQRLQEISGMDVTSFEYQTAMQQITGQEQGEAFDMLKVFKGC